ncbi:hypothetical protein DFQ28_003907 [Apophysomyces sp. BC1034]|nr:hypothetical protein DFQ30_003862 [Apophysomyces sp. BC1015]KAG0178702.1 hypothetical protein DFQ29_003098 [Apophysomyces sp. BC1021]KAG0189086.1 hypothetical protein DFQ28_003907 [Apophysomyces sp. BC1034]
MSLHPSIIWAQRKSYLLITVEVPDLTDPQVDIKPEKFHFKGRDGKEHKLYEAEFDLWKPIKVENAEKCLTGRNLTIRLYKTEEGFWPHLQKGPKPMFLKVNFDKWVDEDEEENEKESDIMGGMDFSNLMSQAGGSFPDMDDTNAEDEKEDKEKKEAK